MSKKHLFDDRVPTPELAANRYAAVAALNLTDPPHPVAHENFMKMIAKVKADALRETANDLAADIDKATTKTQRRHMQYAIAMLGGRATQMDYHARKLQEEV